MAVLDIIGLAPYYIALSVLWLLDTIFDALVTILAPVIVLLQYAWHALNLPFRLLAAFFSFETLYIYFGVAITIGLLTGTLLHHLSGTINALLRIDGASQAERRRRILEQQQQDRGRTAAAYRADRAERKAREARQQSTLAGSVAVEPKILSTAQLENSDWSPGRDLGPPTPMMGTMILEEDSSSDFSYG